MEALIEFRLICSVRMFFVSILFKIKQSLALVLLLCGKQRQRQEAPNFVIIDRLIIFQSTMS